MAAKEVKFSVEARDKMLRGIDILANARCRRSRSRISGADFDVLETLSGPLPSPIRAAVTRVARSFIRCHFHNDYN